MRDNSMVEIVINRCWGGFSISGQAVRWIRKNCPCEHKETIDKKQGMGDFNTGHRDTDANERACPSLIKVVKTLGRKADGEHAELKIVEVPDEIDYYID